VASRSTLPVPPSIIFSRVAVLRYFANSLLGFFLTYAIALAQTTPSPSQTVDEECGDDVTIGDASLYLDATGITDLTFVPSSGRTLAFDLVDPTPGQSAPDIEFEEILGVSDRFTRTVHAASGEFRYPANLYSLPGPDSSTTISIGAHYRSFEVDGWGSTGDPIATSTDVFGPGWRASWGDAIVVPSAPGDPVTRYTASGSTIEYAPLKQASVTFPGFPGTYVDTTYEGIRGSRILHEHRIVEGAIVGVWYREFADRSRVEYAAVTGTKTLHRKAYFAGNPAEPQWKITFNYTKLDGKSIAPLAAPAGALISIVDHRGLVVSLDWKQVAANVWRVTSIRIAHPTWSWNWGSLTTTFRYAPTAPHQLIWIERPARTVVEDVNRNGFYEASEKLNAIRPITSFFYATGSNRIARVVDESVGSARQWMSMTYDTVLPWRVATQLTGFPGAASPPGSAPRTQSFAYPAGSDSLVWTNAIGTVRSYTRTTNNKASPTVWRVTQLVQTASANDPRPGGYYATGSLTWTFTWDSQTRIRSITDPVGRMRSFTWDPLGRNLVTQAKLSAPGGSPAQTRTWVWSSWDSVDPRLSSRLSLFTDAESVTGTIAYAADATGVTAQITKGGLPVGTIREDHLGRVEHFDEPPFSVVGGGTSTRRVRYFYGANSASMQFGLVESLTVDDGTQQNATTFTFAGIGHLVAIQDGLGRVTTMLRDPCDNVVWMELPATGTGVPGGLNHCRFQYAYNLRGLLAVVERPALMAAGVDVPYSKSVIETQHVYDSFGRPWIERTDVGDVASATKVWQERTWTHDAADRRVTQSDHSGNRHELVFDDHDRLYKHRFQVTMSTWGERTYGFSAAGLLLEEKDATGLVTTYVPDAFHRVGRENQHGGRSVDYFWDDENRRTRSEFRHLGTLLRTDSNTYDLTGKLLTRRVSLPGAAQDVVTTYTWTGGARLRRVKDESGRSTTYEYDGAGRLAKVADDLISEGIGNTTVFLRNVEGEIYEERFTTYEDTGATLVPRTRTLRYTLDSWSRVHRIEDLGTGSIALATETFAYDSLDHNVLQTDVSGREIERRCGGTGRMYWTRVSPKPGSIGESPIDISAAYDDHPADPNLCLVITRTDGTGKTSQTLTGLDGRAVEERHFGYSLSPRARVWTYDYDLEQRLLGWVDGNGTSVRNDLDAEKRIVRTWVQTPWFGLSKLGTEFHYDYDAMSNVTRATTWWNDFGNAGGRGSLALLLGRVESEFDGFGRITRQCFGFGDDGSHIPVLRKPLLHGWTDGSGAQDFDVRRSLGMSSGWQMSYSIGNTGTVSSIALAGNGVSLPSYVRYRYDGKEVSYFDVVPGTNPVQLLHTTLARNSLGYDTGRTTRFGSGSPSDPLRYALTVTRDAFGNALDVRYAKNDGSAGDWFELEGSDRLKGAKYGVSAADFASGSFSLASFSTRQAFHLDAANNRTATEQQVAGQPTLLIPYALEAGTNQYASVGGATMLHDGNGNLVFDGSRIYLYDFMDRLSEVHAYNPGPPPTTVLLAAYGYDPSGRRIAKVDGAGARYYTWDGPDLLEEFDSGGQAVTAWFNDPNSDTSLGFARFSGGQWQRYSFISGLNGSVVGIVDATGSVIERYEYDVFGNRKIFGSAGQPLASSAVGNDVGFIGRPHDDTGFVYCRSRYYSPGTGRFLSGDPIGNWEDGINLGNAYTYGGNRPSAFADSTGEIGWLCRKIFSPKPKPRKLPDPPRKKPSPHKPTGHPDGGGSPGGKGSSRGSGNVPDDPPAPKKPDNPAPPSKPDNPAPPKKPDNPEPEKKPDGPTTGGRPVDGPGGNPAPGGTGGPSGGSPPRSLDDPGSLTGATPAEIEELVKGWKKMPTRDGGGTRWVDPDHPDRTVRIMPGKSPLGKYDPPEKAGPYCRVGRGKGEGPHIPLKGNPTLNPPAPAPQPPPNPPQGGNPSGGGSQ
jgi:RHS repeat-associated protein